MVGLPIVPNCFITTINEIKGFFLTEKGTHIIKDENKMITGNKEQCLLPVNGNNCLVIKSYTS